MTTSTRRLNPLMRRRRALGLTRRDLAALADCSVQSINNLEQGLVPRRSEVLDRVKAALAAKEAER